MIKTLLARCWVLSALLLVSPVAFSQILAPLTPRRTVDKIEIRHLGPPAASDELIRANIRVKPGDTYTRTGVDDDVQTLYSTGLFHNIQVLEDITPQGVTLIYVLQGKPILSDIQFEGNTVFSRRKLLNRTISRTGLERPITPGSTIQPRVGLVKAESLIGKPLNESQIFFFTQEILEMYQRKGYQNTKVDYELNIDETTGRGVVVIQIKESPKVRIERVEFVGAEAFSQRRLRRVIKTRRWWIFSWITGSGVLKNDQFQEDRERLAEFYRTRGYIDFEIKDVQFDYLDPSHMILRFIVSEGNQYKVGSVDITGNSVFADEEILRGDRNSRPLQMLAGATFTPQGLERDLEAIRDFYGGKGYIDTWVRVNKIPNTETGTMDLVYEVVDEDRGRSFIEKIQIQGNTKTKDNVIRRELAVSPGEVFDYVRVKRSRSRLEQMNYFDKVETDPEPTEIPNRKNLIIDVEEGSTGSFELGAGFSSVDSLVGFVGYREGNFDLFNPPFFRGGGQKLRVYLQLGTRRRDFQVSFVEPWFLNRKLALGTDLYHRELNFLSDLYDLTQTGARVSLTRALGSDFFLGTVSYTIENIGIDDVDDEAPLVIKEEPSDRLVSKVGLSLAYDTRNNVQLPNWGQRTELLTELAGGPLGADTDFYKLVLKSSWYFPGFFEGHVWEIRGQAGVVDNYGRTDRVPLFDRFFLGGIGSLRGYRYRDVGPQQDSEPVGGETFWFGSVEYSIPIIERLRFALFYDIGNVYPDAYSFDRAPGQKFYNDNWGIGLRINIPRLGPLRLDYGFPITHDESTSGSGRFQFSVGYTADY